jgi:hypothetical protein
LIRLVGDLIDELPLRVDQLNGVTPVAELYCTAQLQLQRAACG